MKRSIVQQGPTTMMVSLPIKWVRKYNLSKGNELDIEESGSKLSISTENKQLGQKAKIRLDSKDKLLIWRSLQPLYINGYDEIKIHFSDPKTLDIIQNLVISSLIGYEITSHEKTYCIINSISNELEKQFPKVFKKVFLDILKMSDVFLKHFKEKEEFSTILNLELTNNRQTMFLKRILLREGIEDKKNIPFMYSLMVLLEKIANEYKYLAWYLRDNKNLKISKETIAFYEKINKELISTHNLFFSYSHEKTEEIIVKGLRVEQIKNLFKKDPEIAYSFMRITDLTKDCLFQIMNINS
jgi:phosphate uptake regulator